MRTQRERVQESSRRLIEAAIELIAERGYSQTTAKDIGLRAGYSRAMVAERFGDKEALLDVILEEYYEGLLNATVGPGMTGLEAVLAPIESLAEFVRTDPKTMRALFVLNFEAAYDTAVLRERVRYRIEHLQTQIREGVIAGLADGSIRSELDPIHVAREIIIAGIGRAYTWIVLSQPDDFAADLDSWRDAVHGWLRADS